jgi:hypothetical protein
MLLLIAAAEETSKTPFYVVAGVFAAWAVLVGVLGVTRPAFPHGEAGARVVMGLTFVLMVATMVAAVATA